MTKKTRTAISVFFLLAFLIIAPSVVFYAQGYRLDLKTWKITKTGAFYLKILPKGSDIFLNGVLKEKASSSLFISSVLIENLLPGSYLIEVKKDGYLDWKKQLEIKPMAVTEVKNILLFPEEMGFENVSRDVVNIFPSPDNKKILLQKRDNQGYYLTLLETENNLERIIIKEKEIYRKAANAINSVSWLTDSQKFVLDIAVLEQQKFILIDPAKTPIKPLVLNPTADFSPEKIMFDPNNTDRFFTLEQGNIILNEIASRQSRPIASSTIAFAIDNNDLYVLKTNGFVYKTDFSGTVTEQKINTTAALAIKEETGYELKINKANFFLSEGNKLFLLNERTSAFEEIIPLFGEWQICPDNKKIAFSKNSQIWLYFLEERADQPAKIAGEKSQLTELGGNITQLAWLNANHLIFINGNQIKTTETDDRPLPNIFGLAELPEIKSIFFNKDNKKISVLTETNFLVSLPILP